MARGRGGRGRRANRGGSLIASDKVRARSDALGRDYHADRFVVGSSPQVGMILVGGSGMTVSEYERRARSRISLESTLAAASRELVFVYASAPYDVPFGKFRRLDSGMLDGPESTSVAARRDAWNRHVNDELFALIPAGLPIVLAGYSGGAALILAGAHEDRRCVGACAIGADGVSRETVRGPSWWAPALFLYNLADPVFDTDANADVLDELEATRVIECHRARPGDHAFESYRANGSLLELIAHACAPSGATPARDMMRVI